MSRSLNQTVNEFLIVHGDKGMAELCRAADRSEKTIARWLKDGVPTQHDAYVLAKACKCTDEEALKIAKECPSEASRTA